MVGAAGRMFGRCVEVCSVQGFRRIEAANLAMLGLMVLLELRFADAEQRLRYAV